MSVLKGRGFDIAIVGSGISGLAAAWLLSRRHRVTLFEEAPRIGGHSNTVMVDGPDGKLPVDTGFIVYNPPNYPNLTALFAHLGIAVRRSCMSFAVSRDDGALEYAGSNLATLFAQPGNAFKPAFLSMLRDLVRFYRTAEGDLAVLERKPTTLGMYLEAKGYGAPFRDNHLLPMAAAIWSAPAASMLDYPAAAFVRFYANHGLLKLGGQPPWHTVVGGSRAYVERLTASIESRIRRGTKIVEITRTPDGVYVRDHLGNEARFDHVVVGTHADQALAMLTDASGEERTLLGAFAYTSNTAVLHADPSLMPKRRRVWSSWNYIARSGVGRDRSHVTYWMNRLQGIDSERPLLVTLNPQAPPAPHLVLHTETYRHPVFNQATAAAQRQLWSLQGRRNTWFCGAYFGAGFHEDGLQAGLAVAEDLGGERRPWHVEQESGRIWRGSDLQSNPLELAS